MSQLGPSETSVYPISMMALSTVLPSRHSIAWVTLPGCPMPVFASLLNSRGELNGYERVIFADEDAGIAEQILYSRGEASQTSSRSNGIVIFNARPADRQS
jgi:hypothetical protein